MAPASPGDTDHYQCTHTQREKEKGTRLGIGDHTHIAILLWIRARIGEPGGIESWWTGGIESRRARRIESRWARGNESRWARGNESRRTGWIESGIRENEFWWTGWIKSRRARRIQAGWNEIRERRNGGVKFLENSGKSAAAETEEILRTLKAQGRESLRCLPEQRSREVRVVTTAHERMVCFVIAEEGSGDLTAPGNIAGAIPNPSRAVLFFLVAGQHDHMHERAKGFRGGSEQDH